MVLAAFASPDMGAASGGGGGGGGNNASPHSSTPYSSPPSQQVSSTSFEYGDDMAYRDSGGDAAMDRAGSAVSSVADGRSSATPTPILTETKAGVLMSPSMHSSQLSRQISLPSPSSFGYPSHAANNYTNGNYHSPSLPPSSATPPLHHQHLNGTPTPLSSSFPSSAGGYPFPLTFSAPADPESSSISSSYGSATTGPHPGSVLVASSSVSMLSVASDASTAVGTHSYAQQGYYGQSSSQPLKKDHDESTPHYHPYNHYPSHFSHQPQTVPTRSYSFPLAQNQYQYAMDTDTVSNTSSVSSTTYALHAQQSYYPQGPVSPSHHYAPPPNHAMGSYFPNTYLAPQRQGFGGSAPGSSLSQPSSTVSTPRTSISVSELCNAEEMGTYSHSSLCTRPDVQIAAEALGALSAPPDASTPSRTPPQGFIERVSNIPIVRDSLTTFSSAYEATKNASHPLVRGAAETVETGVKTISRPVLVKLEPALKPLDRFACSQLDRVCRRGICRLSPAVPFFIFY
ncbi:hypothetical protein BC829DRAFT_385283 [Chytridium lagenaria]|nr:hypothetical protein BC829DRAFT_385283 [Chytridium lagenaria]